MTELRVDPHPRGIITFHGPVCLASLHFLPSKKQAAEAACPSEPALAFGAELQLERERRHISIASIAEVTKVPARHLLALETERFDILPGGIFTKGILRSYCRQVGLDEAEWLGRMPGQLQADPDPEWTQFAENVSRTRVQQGPRMFWRWWGILAMVLALAALGWCAWIFAVRPQVAAIPGINVSWFGNSAHAQTEPPAESPAEPQQEPSPTASSAPPSR